MRQIEKQLLLQSIDGLWREHLITLDHLSKVVGWRGLAQRDPLNEYKQEAYELFQTLLDSLRELVIAQLSHVQVQMTPPEPEPQQLSEQHIDPTTGENNAVSAANNIDPEDPSTWGKVRRNEMCPCGTGKKYKHCHGAIK